MTERGDCQAAQITCHECSGSGTCSDCNGQSVADHNDSRFCDACDGDHMCLRCGGYGLIVNQEWLATVAREHWAMGHPVEIAKSDEGRLQQVTCGPCRVTLWEDERD